MSFIDDLKNAPPTQLGGTDKIFIDADTLAGPDGSRYRIQGIDAPEIEKVTGQGYQQGTAGGQQSVDIISGLASEQGFTNVVPLLDENGRPQKDPFGRTLIDLKDGTGRSFRSAILESGVLGANEYTTDTDRVTSQLGQLRRDQAQLAGIPMDTEWDLAREQLMSAMEGEGHKQQGFKQAALDEFERATILDAGLGRYLQDTVQITTPGVGFDGQSLNPLSDSWEQGWIGVKEGAYGALNLLGESTGIDTLSEIGEDGVERARYQLGDGYGRTLTDWKDINGFTDVASFVGNNIALSLPYMITAIGSATAAAPLGGAVGLAAGIAAPATVYTGQTWNEMEGEKSASTAVAAGIAQASLDRLGLSYLVQGAKGVGGKELLQRGVAELQKKGLSKQAAEAAVHTASRKELAGLLGDVATIAKQQVTAKAAGQQLLGRAGVGGVGEGLTEIGQETTAYLAATLGSDKEFNWKELQDRQIAAGIAGGTLGSAFSVPGAAYDVGAWADVAVRQAPADAKRLSDAGRWANEELAKEGRIKSVSELNKETDEYINRKGKDNIVTLDERIDAANKKRGERTFTEKVGNIITAVPGLFKGSINTIIPHNIRNQSRAARKLAGIFGGQLQKTFSGASYENEKFHRLAIYKNIAPFPDTTFAFFNNGKIPTSKQKAKISERIYDKLRAAIDENGNFDPDRILARPEEKAILMDVQQKLQALSDKMYDDQAKHNPELGKLHNYLLRYKSFDKNAIRRNRQGFIDKLVARGINPQDAADIADSIASNPDVNDFGEAFSAIKGEFVPGSHNRRTLNLAEDPEFKDFMEKDIFANVSNAAKSAARYTAQKEFVGLNGEKIAALLQEMQEEGVDPDMVNAIAKGMQDYLDAESGNYKRAKSQFGKDLEKVQRNFMMWSTVAGLPLATISSFVEFALSARGLTQEQIFGKKGSLKAAGTELGGILNGAMDQVAFKEWRGQKTATPVDTWSRGQQMLKNLGFYEWDVGAATVTGATEINAYQQRIYDTYFKMTGLTQWTNYTRAIRASIAGDYILDKLETIATSDPDYPTNESQEATEALRNIGMNVEAMLAHMGATATGNVTPEMEAEFESNMREATFNFINDAVALPQAANRPLIYQDPRFALFTQFQGFISTFTANHIPKLWGEYVKRGTPAMKYNAFAIMATMVMLGFASQYLKDLIKFGQRTPYLEDAEYLQRGIRASGLLGTGERVLDQFFPLYDQRSSNTGDWILNTTTGEAPAISNLKRAADIPAKLLQGDPYSAGRNVLKVSPLSPTSDWLLPREEWVYDRNQ